VKVSLVDLSAQYIALEAELKAAFERVARSGRYVLGPEVEQLETEIAALVGVRHAVGVSSGTDALLCAMLALGVGPGDEVVTTPFTFFATIEAIVRTGATPRFVDIRPDTFNLDEMRVEAAIGPHTRLILPVHLFGIPADLEPLAKHGIPVLEDAAQALGARYRGRCAGSVGRLAAFSFHPTKGLGALGDGGMITTDDAGLAERCRLLRNHGSPRKHQHTAIGGNFRLDALQAALLRVKLPHLEAWLAARRSHAAAYTAALSGIDGLVTPVVPPDVIASFAQYTLRVRDGRRNALAAALAARGIECAVHYPEPAYRQPALLALELAGSCPEAERAAGEVLSIPLYAELGAAQRDHVIAAVRAFFR